MKRCVLGAVLLLGLLFAGLGCWMEMEKAQSPVCRQLLQAVALSEAGEETGAMAAAREAKALWRQRWKFAAAVADQSPMEQIDSLFSGLDAYPADSQEFRACCLQLVRQVEAMVRAQSPDWWNLLACWPPGPGR